MALTEEKQNSLRVQREYQERAEAQKAELSEQAARDKAALQARIDSHSAEISQLTQTVSPPLPPHSALLQTRLLSRGAYWTSLSCLVRAALMCRNTDWRRLRASCASSWPRQRNKLASP